MGNGTYTLMDKDGYYYAGWRTSVYKVGDVRPGDVYSPIEITKSYDIRDGLPEDQRDKISRIFGFGMTYDGYLAIAMPGIIAVMTRDFEHMQYILLEGEAVDNGISVDDQGGIHCVTSKYMRKVVWDGKKKLSDKEADQRRRCRFVRGADGFLAAAVGGCWRQGERPGIGGEVSDHAAELSPAAAAVSNGRASSRAAASSS